jgi:hypothetical protein
MLDALRALGRFAARAFGYARSSGLTDDVLDLAYQHVVKAAQLFVENKDKRNWVLLKLQDQGVSESLARLAIELAVQLLKKKVL